MIETPLSLFEQGGRGCRRIGFVSLCPLGKRFYSALISAATLHCTRKSVPEARVVKIRLRLVRASRGVAAIQVAVEVAVDCDGVSRRVELHLEHPVADRLDCPERARSAIQRLRSKACMRTGAGGAISGRASFSA
jgi:hypothetical protein